MKQKLQKFEEQLVRGKGVTRRVRWRHEVDIVSKRFFKAITKKPTSTTITMLKSENGVEIHDRPTLECLCKSLYSLLYNA